VPAGRHAQPGRRGAAAAPDDGRGRVQRCLWVLDDRPLPRGHLRPGSEPPRRVRPPLVVATVLLVAVTVVPFLWFVPSLRPLARALSPVRRRVSCAWRCIATASPTPRRGRARGTGGRGADRNRPAHGRGRSALPPGRRHDVGGDRRACRCSRLALVATLQTST
jgi:hypothetical protein